MRHEPIIQTKRTQTVRFVLIIDPKVDLATTKEEEPATLLIVNGEEERNCYGNAVRLQYSQSIAAECG